MITVYVWNQARRGAAGVFCGIDGASVGHAAMEISGGEPSGSVYVSWWPRHDSWNDVLGGTPAYRRRNLSNDILAEGRIAPDHYIRIPGRDEGGGPGLDETAMKRWWAHWRHDPTYRLIDRNCSTAVVRGLMAGGAEPYSHRTLYINSEAVLWGPSDVVAIAKACVKGIAASNY